MRRVCVVVLCLLMGLLTVACGSDGGDGGPTEAVVTDYAELSEWISGGEEMVLIDVRTKADFAAGHLQNAINVDLADIKGSDGALLAGGKALTDAVSDKDSTLVLYCFGYGNDADFAKLAIDLGYSSVFRYAGGTQDWVEENGDYLVIEYEGFKAWHDAKFPFDDGSHYLIDDLPEAWYTGEDTAHPGGHIPGALNLPAELFADGEGNPVDQGTALTSLVPDKEATLVIYCGNPACGKSLMGVKAAVKLGYRHVYRYQGGWQEWQDEGNALKPGLDP